MDIEQLLHEEESTSLDFKSEAYKFSGANEFQKSELLKDILAFANAWRRSTAYILLGVKEVKGGRSIPVGITDELDDAQLQEFINKKTQRPLTFAYKTYTVDNLKIGVIEIPTQQRPLYITKDYGKLRRNIVPIRIGSSTSEASPDDVIKMAQAERKKHIELPNLEVLLADIENETLLGHEVTITPTILDMSRYDEIADFKDPEPEFDNPLGILVPAYISNPLREVARENYYRELAFFEYMHEKARYISFAITNPSNVSVSDVTVNITINKNEDKFSIFTPSKLPERPNSHDSIIYNTPHIMHSNLTERLHPKDNTFKLEELETAFRVTLTFRKIQPKQTIFCEKKLCLDSSGDYQASADTVIYADNLATPIKASLSITCKTRHKTKSFKGLSNPTTSYSNSSSSGLILGDLKIKTKKDR